jgi:hypothetical protein
VALTVNDSAEPSSGIFSWLANSLGAMANQLARRGRKKLRGRKRRPMLVLEVLEDPFAPGTITSIDIQPLGASNTVLVNSLPPGFSVNIVSTGSDFIGIGNGTLANVQGQVTISP